MKFFNLYQYIYAYYLFLNQNDFKITPINYNQGS